MAANATAFAQQPPVIVLDTRSAGSPAHKTALSALERVAAARGTVVIDLFAAQPAEPEAPGLLGRAIEAYHAFDYDRAIELLDRAIADAESTGARGLTPEQLADLHLFRALSRTQKSDTAAAWAELVRAAALDPTRILDSMQFPPRVVEAFGRAVTAVRDDGTVTLEFTVPQGCQVWLDARGVTPGEPIALARGEHYVRVSCPDREPYGASKLVAGDTVLEPSLASRPTPSLSRAANEAKQRGAATVLWAHESAGSEPVTFTLELADAQSQKSLGTVIVRVKEKRLADAADRLVARTVDPPPELSIVEPIPPTDEPWYRKSWILGIAGGAAVATAILLPFVLDSGEPTGFNLDLGGDAR